MKYKIFIKKILFDFCFYLQRTIGLRLKKKPTCPVILEANVSVNSKTPSQVCTCWPGGNDALSKTHTSAEEALCEASWADVIAGVVVF